MDEVVLIRAYRISTAEHQQNIRLFAAAAASESASEGGSQLIALVART